METINDTDSTLDKDGAKDANNTESPFGPFYPEKNGYICILNNNININNYIYETITIKKYVSLFIGIKRLIIVLRIIIIFWNIFLIGTTCIIILIYILVKFGK